DIGCGTGQLAKEISDEYPFVDYLGIDVTKNMISLAKKSNDGKKVRFINTSVDDFICDERFDIIICTHAFPYFPNKEKAMSKMYKLCKEGGKVIIVSSSTNNLKDLLANLIVKTKTGRAKYLSVKQMKHLLSCAGFTVKSVDVIRERAYMPTIALFYAEK
ncbi:MAG: class I SAM-dependent methyltransferase, partial [Clostridia bacterium]|nr:class I SAM-dependent methyltransferase [Clostridia bacterium]